MTNTRPGNQSTNDTLEPGHPHPMDIAISPSQFVSSAQKLVLIRYLQDIKNVPTEQFRQAARELGLTDHSAAARQARSDNPGQPTPVDHEAATAVLIRTFFNTELPERPPAQSPPITMRPPNLPHPHTWPSVFKYMPPDYQQAAIARGFRPDSPA